MSLRILLFAILASGYVILSAWALDVESKVDAANDRENGVLDKRDLKGESTIAKFLDPAPEYYRGPGSVSSSSSYNSERDRIRDRDRDSYVLGLQRPPYGGSSSSGSGYDSRFPPQPPRGTVAPTIASNRYGGFQDRIGYGGPPPYGSTTYANPTPSSRYPYGQPTPIDFPSSYGSSPSSYGSSTNSYGGSTNPYGGTSYYPPPSYGSSGDSFWSKKGFPGVQSLFPSAGSNDFYDQDKKALTKSILVPLIGGAILGIAATLVANPALLHLGTLGLAGKRRRRDTSEQEHNLAGVASDKKTDHHAHSLAYRAYRQKKLL